MEENPKLRRLEESKWKNIVAEKDRAIRTLQQQNKRIKIEIEDWKNGYNPKDALIEIEKIVGES